MRTNLMNVRPHPGPLPQERENYLPHFDDAHALGGRVPFAANDLAAACAIATNKFHIDAVWFTLSPGERAGVRASVNLTFRHHP